MVTSTHDLKCHVFIRTYLSIHIYLYIYPWIIHIRLSIYIYPYIYPCIYPCIYPYIYPCIYPCIFEHSGAISMYFMSTSRVGDSTTALGSCSSAGQPFPCWARRWILEIQTPRNRGLRQHWIPLFSQKDKGDVSPEEPEAITLRSAAGFLPYSHKYPLG